MDDDGNTKYSKPFKVFAIVYKDRQDRTFVELVRIRDEEHETEALRYYPVDGQLDNDYDGWIEEFEHALADRNIEASEYA